MRKVQPVTTFLRECPHCGQSIFPHYEMCSWCTAEKEEREAKRAKCLEIARANLDRS